MAYILMVMVWFGDASYSGYSAEFNTREACIHAGEVSNKKFGGLTTFVYWECVPKG